MVDPAETVLARQLGEALSPLGFASKAIGAELASAAGLKQGVDAVDNQTCIVQSIFVVDLARGSFQQARTWGQVITGQFQDAIASCLARTYRSET